MKRILFVIPTLGGGGAERVLTNIINHLDRNKYRIELLLVLRYSHVFLKNIGKDVLITQLNLSTRIRFSAFKTLSAIKRIDPDIVFMGFGELNAIVSPFIPFFRKYKWVARETSTVSQKTKSWIPRTIYKKFYSNFDLIIAQSIDMKKDLETNFGIDFNKIKIINNPINTREIDNKLNEKVDKKLPKSVFNIVACGRLTTVKGFDHLIRSVQYLNKNDYHLTIFGSGNLNDKNNQEQYLRYIINELGLSNNVTFEGFQENIHNFFAEADLFILSSHHEGFPNALIEALYCGLPALTNNFGVMREIINKDNGIIHSVTDHKGFADCIKRFMNNEIAFESKKIKKNIIRKYSIKLILSQYEKVFETL